LTSNQLLKPFLVLALTIPAFAETPAIGMATTNNDRLTLDHSVVSGNATVFDGSTIESGGYSRIHLNNGTRVDFGAGSSGQVFQNATKLTSGMSEVQSPAGYEIDVNSLKVQPSEANSVARVRVESDKRVVVMALNAPVNVLDSQGLLVAKVLPSSSMAFMPQAGSANAPFDQTGCVLQKGTSAVLVPDDGKQVWELHGASFNKGLIGNHARVVGIVDASATPTAGSGAQNVVAYSSIHVTKRGGCTNVAGLVGASAVASAGLAVGAAGGAAAAGAAAAAAGAGVAAGTAVGVSTAVVVAAGVGAAAVAGVTGAAAAGALSSSSSQ
jgi:hypothetical protein